MPVYAFGSPEALLLLLAAMAVETATGNLWYVFHRLSVSPGTLAFRCAVFLDRKLNRLDRSDVARMIRGLLVELFVIALAGASGLFVGWLGRAFPYGLAAELVVVVSCLSLRGSWTAIAEVFKELQDGGLANGRQAVRGLTAHDPDTLDAHGVVRVAVEATAKALNQHVVAPAFWYVLLGLPGLLVWTAVNATDAAIGHRGSRYDAFGLTAARLDDALNFLPARFSGLLIAAAAVFVGSARPLTALRTMLRDARYHRSMNSGWPAAAMAGALGLALGGPRVEGQVVIQEVWIGHGRARAIPADIRRALALYAVGCLLLATLLISLLALVAAL